MPYWKLFAIIDFVGNAWPCKRGMLCRGWELKPALPIFVIWFQPRTSTVQSVSTAILLRHPLTFAVLYWFGETVLTRAYLSSPSFAICNRPRTNIYTKNQCTCSGKSESLYWPPFHSLHPSQIVYVHCINGILLIDLEGAIQKGWILTTCAPQLWIANSITHAATQSWKHVQIIGSLSSWLKCTIYSCAVLWSLDLSCYCHRSFSDLVDNLFL